MALANGDYTIEVSLSGGSGRATVKSPANLTVSDRGMKAEIEWSSPNYDYMKIGENEYYPLNSEGNSTFLIDVETLDTDIQISAETVAMSKPHIIDYTIRFDSSTAKPVNGVSYALILSIIGVSVLIAGAAAYVKRRITK